MYSFYVTTQWLIPNIALQGPSLSPKGKTVNLMYDFEKTERLSKPMALWTPPEVREWLCEEAFKRNYDYEKIDLSCFRDVNGQTLMNMTIDDFEKKCKENGHFLFKMVKQYIINEEIRRTGNLQIANKYGMGKKIIMNGVGTITHSLPRLMSNTDLKKRLTAIGKTIKYMNDFSKLREGSKPMIQWSPPKVREWICREALKNNYDYEKIDLSCFRDVNGETLLNMTRDDFQKRDKENGEFIFKTVEHSKNKKSQRKGKKCCSVLEFIQGLLKDPTYCPSIICWENYEKGIFRFVHTKKVAKLWGYIKGNPTMDFGKLSRAMRYYYGKNILHSETRKLVYSFGESATGWQTDDPNFQKSRK